MRMRDKQDGCKLNKRKKERKKDISSFLWRRRVLILVMVIRGLAK